MRVQQSILNGNQSSNLFRCFAVAAALSLAAAPAPATVCVVPDDGTGTAAMPPQCPAGYQSPDDVHEIIDGLPPGTTIIIDASHTKFGLTSSGAGGNLGGEFERFNSLLILSMRGTGALQGFARTLFVPVQSETHIGPRTPGDAVQSFPTEMVQLQGEIFGDPDFDVLRITGGTNFGLPGPGQTTLTQIPGGQWQVDSFFDITYKIDFQGAPGSWLTGMLGTTTATLRMQAGQATEPDRFVECGDPSIPTLSSRITFGTTDVPALPQGFFGAGTPPFTGVVPLVGEPLGVATGPVSTMVQRPFDPIPLTAPVGSAATVPTEIIAMSLKSASPVVVNTAVGPTFWDLRVTLAPAPPPQGSMDVQKTHANGGTFIATLPVVPLLTFTNTANPADVRVFDWSLVPGLAPLQLRIAQADWVHTVSPTLNVQATSNKFYPGILDTGGTQTISPVQADSTGGGVTHIVCPPPPPPPPDLHATCFDPADPTLPVTTVTFGGLTSEIPAIPAGFFGRNSLRFEGTVTVVGRNFDPTSDASVRLQRTDDPLRPSDPVGTTRTVEIEMVSMSLVSVDPITVLNSDGSSSLHKLFVGGLPSTGTGGQRGFMTATKTHPNGGTADSFFDVFTEISFEDEADGTVRTLTLTDPLRMSISVSWVHNVDPNLGLVLPPGAVFNTGIEHEDIGIVQRVRPAVAVSAGGAVSHGVCPPRPLLCRPTADQLACEPGTCPGTTDPCVPIRWKLDANGQWLVLECDCVTANQCHFDPFLATGPGCTGGCPGLSDVCREFALDTDGDGIADTFSCSCVTIPPGACCLADGTCSVAATAADCAGKFHPATSCLGDNDGDGVDDLCQASICSQCPAGAHWIDLTPCPLVDPDTDTFGSAAKLGIDLDGDCIADTNLVMSGPATILKRGPLDDSVQFPGLRAIDAHNDVVDTEMLSMSLTGGGATMIAGAGLGTNPLPASLGAVAELSANPSLADSFFNMFVEISGGGLAGPAYNQTAIVVQTTVPCLPPKGKYIHITGCTPIFDSPIPGTGNQVGNLVSAMHFTFPDCCNADGTCTANVAAAVCKQNLGTPVPACLGDSNGDLLDDACSPPTTLCPEPAGQDWCLQRQAIDCIPNATDVQFCLPRSVSFGAAGLNVKTCGCFSDGPGCGPVTIRPILGTTDVEFSCQGVCPDGTTNCQIFLAGVATGQTVIKASATNGAQVTCDCPPPPPGSCCLADGTCVAAATAADCNGKFHPAIDCLGDNDGDGVDDLCQASICSQCPAGAHWIDLTPCPLVDPDTDTFGSAAKLGIDLDGDCIADTNLVMSGPATILKRGPLDDSIQFPGLRAIDAHNDVVDTEMLSMSLTGGGATMIAGAGLGTNPLSASLGAVAELSANPSLADSFFNMFVEISGGGLAGPAYNQTAIVVQTTVPCLPPKGKYIHITGCTPIFDSPIPGTGTQVGNLVSAMHFTFPDCCNADGTCTANVAAAVCKANLGTPVPACLGDSNGDGLDDACSPPTTLCPEPAGQDWCLQRQAIDCIPNATDVQFCLPRSVSFGAAGLNVKTCGCFSDGPGCGPVTIRPILGTTDVEFSCQGVCPDGSTDCQIFLNGTATGQTVIKASATNGAQVTCDCPPPVCGPDATQSACAPVTCPIAGDSCSRTCVNYNPVTGVTLTTQCDCKGPNECHVATAGVAGAGAVAAAAVGNCVVPDDTTGTVDLPPAGCAYLTADQVHEIVDGLPVGTTIELAAIHKDFICADQPGGPPGVCSFPPPILGVNCDEPGGSLGGEKECRTSTIALTITGSCPGTLCGFSRSISVLNVSFETHTGPRTSGDAVQSFDTDMFRLQGDLFGDPDFCTLRLTAGTDFGLPSPGHTTLTRLGPPGSSFQVDSFFDISYRIDFQGCPGSILDGMSGSTTGTVRMQTGAPTCKGTCPPGDICEETRTTLADGTIDICCKCVTPPAVCEPTADGSACKPTTCVSDTQTCLPRVIEISTICAGTTIACTTDADCAAIGTGCVRTSRVVECGCADPNACHVTFDAAIQVPVCTGTCPAGQTCDLFGTDVDGDGSFDQFHCECVTPPACKPNATGTACEQFVCPGPLPPIDACQARCAVFDPLTGKTEITDCACIGADQCHLVVAGGPAGGASGEVAAASGDDAFAAALAAGTGCTVVDNGGGTVTLPPAGCDYLTADEVHEIANGLPAGTTLELAAIHKDFICLRDPAAPSVCSFTPPAFGVDCDVPGGSLGGEKECAESKLIMRLTGSCPGPLCGFVRVLTVPVTFEVHTAPRMPGDAEQSFDTDMFRLQGQLGGDPDFDLLKVTAGTDFGLQSPGHTTLTKLPSGDFQVDSFFDITYTIEFSGAIGGALSGLSGSTTGRVRMQTGAPSCKGNCPPNTLCREQRTPHIGPGGTPDGRVDVCCDCACKLSKAPRPDTILDGAGATVTSAKNRFLSFGVTEAGMKAVRVRIVSLWGVFSPLNGLTYWVDVPFVASELAGKSLTEPVGTEATFLAAKLRTTPQFMDWSALGIVHVFDERIIPSRQRSGTPPPPFEPAIYEIQVIDQSCDRTFEASYSPALQITNPKWGDSAVLSGGQFLAPDGAVSIDDILGFIAKFGGAVGAPIKARTELLGVTTGPVAAIDGKLTISDLLEILSAFGGGAYPFPSPGP